MDKRFVVYPASVDTPHSNQIIQQFQITRGLFTGTYGTMHCVSLMHLSYIQHHCGGFFEKRLIRKDGGTNIVGPSQCCAASVQDLRYLSLMSLYSWHLVAPFIHKYNHKHVNTTYCSFHISLSKGF